MADKLRIRFVVDAYGVDDSHGAFAGTEWDVVAEAPKKGYYFRGKTGQMVLALYSEVVLIEVEKI